ELNVPDAPRELLHQTGNARIAFSAHARRPLDRSAHADLCLPFTNNRSISETYLPVLPKIHYPG
ncbi:MAG: hypothetical protein MUP03_04365, partial [Anaerolineales bacterium]|nr:hypothetical protein [Anaerolineales bacterium]